MATSAELLPRLKYRSVQPVDIPICHELEQLSYEPEDQASKATLQHRQHHAAPFFRCVLLKKQSEILEDGVLNGLNLTESGVPFHEPQSTSLKRSSSNEEACHHIHHSNHNHLIGYVCGTRCHDFATAMDIKPTELASKNTESHTLNNSSNTRYPYPMKHEPSGRYLAIHSLVVQPEYRNQGVARSLLENYIRSIETFNASADSAKPVITHRGSVVKDRVQKRPTKIEKLILVTKSHLLDFFVSLGFRWRATISLGTSSVYELERDVTSALPSVSPTSPVAAAALICALPFLHSQPNNSMEQDCYLVDAFANPRRCGSGNAAAIVVLDGPPSKLIAERQSKMKDDEDGQWGMMNEQLNEILSNVIMDEEDEEELAEMRAEVWMHFVAREFHQPATAFVWPIFETGEDDVAFLENDLSRPNPEIVVDQHHRMSSRLSVLSDESEDITEPSSNENVVGSNQSNTYELHHYIRFYTRTGIEVDMCAHATLAAASTLFRRYASEQQHSSSHLLARNKELVLAFHSRKDITLRANRAPPSPLDESISGHPTPISTPKALRHSTASNHSSPTPLMSGAPQAMKLPNIIRIAMDYPWRTVDPVPADGQAAVIAMLRRAFFGAWSVVAQEEEDHDHETDELAFSLSVNHVLFIGVTKGGEDLLIELSVEGFELLCGRSVDYVALKQGWNGYTRGVIVCCEVPEVSAGLPPGDLQQNINARPSNVVRNVTLNDLVNPLGGQLDFRSRYFEPKVGVNEDPVSGWPHCALAPYFGVRRRKQRLIGIQESDRTGLVECILKEDEHKVCICGSTVTTLSGKLQMQA